MPDPIPPLPAGFRLVSPAADEPEIPPLPAGFRLVEPKVNPVHPDEHLEQDPRVTMPGHALAEMAGSDAAINIPDPATVLVKAARDMGVGLASLPTDILQAFGFENAGDLSKAIQTGVPKVAASGGEAALATAAQYGAPAAAAAGAVRAAVPAGNLLTRVIRGVAQAGAAAGSDFAVTDPSQARTFGSDMTDLGETLTGHSLALPTTILPTDTGIERRRKVGAEAGAIGIGTEAVAGMARGLFKFLRPFVNSDAEAEAAVAKYLQGEVRNKDEAVKNIDQVVAEASGTPFEPTFGTASNDPGLIGAERGIANKPPLVERNLQNRRAVSGQLSSLEQQPGSPQDLARHVQGQAGQQIAPSELAVRRLEQQHQAARDEVDNYAAQLTGDLPGASERIDAHVRSELERLTREKNERFRAIDPDNSVQIEPNTLRRALNEAVTPRSALDTSAQRLPQDLIGALDTALTQAERGEAPLTFGALQDIRPDLSAAIRQARAANEGGVVGRLSRLRDAIEGETANLANRGDEAGLRAREALDFFQNTYAPRFKEGVGGRYRQAVMSNRPVPPTAVGSRFVKSGPGSREAAQDLRRIVEGAPDPQTARGAVRDYVASDFAQMAVDPQGRIRPERIAKYLQDRQEVLNQFPDIQTEMRQLSGQVADRVGRVNTLGERLEQARADLKSTQKDVDQSVAGYFVNDDPVKAVGKVLSSTDPVASMRELVSLARKDPTGQATAGLKSALGEHLRQTLRGRSVAPGETDYSIMLNQVERIFKDPKQSRALSLVYSPDEMKILDRVRNEMRIMDRVNMKTTSGSPTEALRQSADRQRIMLASMVGIVKGRGISQMTKWLQRTLGADPVEKANFLLQQAMLDPALGRRLLVSGGQDRGKITQELRTYLVNNYPGMREEDQNQQ